jgi:hypothetical protein
MAPDDPLQPLLDEAEAKLHRRLHAACEAEANGIASESAVEIRRLEDSLLSAAMAAEQVLTVRRHMQRNAKAAEQSSGSASAEPREGRAPDDPRRATAAASRQPREPAMPPADPPSGARALSEQAQPGEGSEQVATAVREFTDCKGRTWRAWPVTPGSARAGQPSRRTLGEFQEGWICFESLDDSARRRLPRHEARWSELRAEELERLLDQAITVQGRKRPAGQNQADADVRLH